MNALSLERQSQILSALVEGNNVRSASRISGAHIGTILSLLKRVGDGCERLMDTSHTASDFNGRISRVLRFDPAGV